MEFVLMPIGLSSGLAALCLSLPRRHPHQQSWPFSSPPAPGYSLPHFAAKWLVNYAGKSTFGCTDIEFVGHCLKAIGISPLPSWVRTITVFPQPPQSSSSKPFGALQLKQEDHPCSGLYCAAIDLSTGWQSEGSPVPDQVIRDVCCLRCSQAGPIVHTVLA